MRILKYEILNELATPRTLSELYERFNTYTKSGIRGTVYKLMRDGLVRRIGEGRDVRYVATVNLTSEDDRRKVKAEVIKGVLTVNIKEAILTKPKPAGGSAHITVPRRWLGKHVMVALLKEEEERR